MSFSCVLRAKKPSRSWVTHLLGPQKETQSCYAFANATLPYVLNSKGNGTIFHFCQSQGSVRTPFPWMQQSTQIGTHTLRETSPWFRLLLDKSRQLLPGSMAKSAQQLHPVEAVALPTSLLSNSWGHALVWVAGFVLLILQLNSFQANKKDQMGIFSYCNNLFLE